MRAIGAGDDRVEVQLGDLREVVGGSAVAVGTVNTRIASTASSAAICSRQRRKMSGGMAAVALTGPATFAPAGGSRRRECLAQRSRDPGYSTAHDQP
ncbi:MAG TPA: hypothetical protein VEH31_35950 [Streptosporangiaceae bacterium]|nr:hypothetical protein [Streptosporangiaceae bacterium]